MRVRIVLRAFSPILLIIVAAGLAADGPSTDPLKDAGLTKAGGVYVLADDSAVVDAMKPLQATKAQADKEVRSRQVIEMQLAAKRKASSDGAKEWHQLESRLTLVTDPTIHNHLVLRMNRLVANQKEAVQSEKDLEEQAAKVSTSAKTKFVDDVAALNVKAGAAAEKYRALSADPAIKAAIAKANLVAGPKAVLGPSPEFTAAAGDLKKWESEVESEAIPLREQHGIHVVDVLLNGEHFLMGVDTGSSAVSLPGEVAEQLKMVPGEQDPTVNLKLADGNVIQGKEMSLKSVRVGRFTVEDVRCVVLQKGLNNPPLLLGASYLNHFIVNVDPAANELHLTAIKGENHKTDAPATKPQ